MVVLSGVLNADEPRLRVGQAETPENAAKELAEIQETIPNLEAWEKRKAVLKAGILEGARLTKLPAKTPLNAKFYKKRVYEGR